MHKDERAHARRSTTTSDRGTSAREAPDFVLLGRMSMLPTLDAPRAARAAIAQWMPASTPRTLLQDAKLLVSELVTNSVRHGGAGGAPIVVSAGTSDRAAWFDVADAGDRSRVSLRPPTGAGGMGLNIVHEVASQWGTSDGDGTHVWFELALRTA